MAKSHPIKINIIAVGKLKDAYIREGVDEYAKRISKYADLKIVQIDDYKLAKETDSDIKRALMAEGEQIEKHIMGYVFALDSKGREFDSIELADRVASVTASNNQLTFIIGGSYGLDNSILKRADTLLSFGKVTYPHQLMRLILAEQIYRSFSIINKHPYHK